MTKQSILECDLKNGMFLAICYSYSYTTPQRGHEDVIVEHATLIDANEQPLNVLQYFTEAELEQMVIDDLFERNEVA